MKKTESAESNKSITQTANESSQCEQTQKPMFHSPMEIIITQPGSSESGTSSTDSNRATLGLTRSNKIYPS